MLVGQRKDLSLIADHYDVGGIRVFILVDLNAFNGFERGKIAPHHVESNLHLIKFL
jgi:hypothetical protein